jgi:hypothetical protein
VLADNPCRKFYEKLGNKFTKSVGIGGITYKEAAYGWKDLDAITNLRFEKLTITQY